MARDVIGLANAAALRPATPCSATFRCTSRRFPSFPRVFLRRQGTDPSKHKQFRRGIEQLEQEGVVQVLRSDRRGDQAPVLAAVGPMQFEVASHRMANGVQLTDFAGILPYTVARAVDPEDAALLEKQVSMEVLTRTDGVMLALFTTKWRPQGFCETTPAFGCGRWSPRAKTEPVYNWVTRPRSTTHERSSLTFCSIRRSCVTSSSAPS